MSALIYPVVLCGGMGSGVWAMAWTESPKQFQPVSGKGGLSCFQTMLHRHRGPELLPPIIVTSPGLVTLVQRQLADLHLSGIVIAEPFGRDTGPALLAAALTAMAQNPEAQMLVLPSDHVISGDLNPLVMQMSGAARDGRIVLFGVPPLYPETGNGFIVDGGRFCTHTDLHRIDQFVAKPPAGLVASLFHDSRSYWASGISLFRADVITEEFLRLEPQTHAAVTSALTGAECEDGVAHLDPLAFGQARSETTERMIFERSQSVALAKAVQVAWNDALAWNGVHKVSGQNAANNGGPAMQTLHALVQSG